MMNNKNDMTVIGLGEFGHSVIEQVKCKSVLIDLDSERLGSSTATQKIKVYKNKDTNRDTTLFSDKFEKAILPSDTVFIVASMYEKTIRDYALEVIEFTKNMGNLTVAIVSLPSRKEKTKVRNDANSFAESIFNSVATVAIPANRTYYQDASIEADEDVFDSLGNYGNGWELWNETGNFDLKFKRRTIGSGIDDSFISQGLIAAAAIKKLFKMLNLDYINSCHDSIKEVLRTPGKIHLVSAHNSISITSYFSSKLSHRACILERKLTESGPLGTVSDLTTKMLLHLILPTNITKQEIEYLCNYVPGRSNPEQFELAITVDETLGNTIHAELLGTDTVTMEDLDEMQ